MDIPLRALLLLIFIYPMVGPQKGWAVHWKEGSDDKRALQQDQTFRRTRNRVWEGWGQQNIWGLGEIASGLQTAFVAIRSRHWWGCYGHLQLWQGSSWGSSEIHNSNSWRRIEYLKEGIYTILRQLTFLLPSVGSVVPPCHPVPALQAHRARRSPGVPSAASRVDVMSHRSSLGVGSAPSARAGWVQMVFIAQQHDKGTSREPSQLVHGGGVI